MFIAYVETVIHDVKKVRYNVTTICLFGVGILNDKRHKEK